MVGRSSNEDGPFAVGLADVFRISADVVADADAENPLAGGGDGEEVLVLVPEVIGIRCGAEPSYMRV